MHLLLRIVDQQSGACHSKSGAELLELYKQANSSRKLSFTTMLHCGWPRINPASARSHLTVWSLAPFVPARSWAVT